MPYISDHPYRILIIGGSGSSKNNKLLNLIKHQSSDIDKKSLYVEHPFESKYQLLINRREKVEIKNFIIQKYFLIIHKQLMMPMKIWRMLIVFDDMIADIESNKKIKSYCFRIVFKRRKPQYCNSLYIKILFQSA